MPDLSGGVRLFGVVDADDVRPMIEAWLGDAAAGEQEGAMPTVTVDGIDVRLLTFRDLAAVVASAPYERTTLVDDDVATYVRVIDALYASGPIVPAPPGTVFQSTQVIQRWLELHYGKLHETLGIIERRASENPPYDYVRMQFGA